MLAVPQRPTGDTYVCLCFPMSYDQMAPKHWCLAVGTGGAGDPVGVGGSYLAPLEPPLTLRCLWTIFPCRASRQCVRHWPSAGTMTPRPGSLRSAWQSASASWSIWTDSRGGAARKRRFLNMAPWTLPNSSARRPGWAESMEAAPVAKEQRQQEAAPEGCFLEPQGSFPCCEQGGWEGVTGSILSLWHCHRISCVSTSSGNEIDLYNSQ